MVDLVSPLGVPICASDTAAPALLDAGFRRAQADVDLTGMTRDELVEYAESAGVSIGKRATKAQIIAAIEGR